MVTKKCLKRAAAVGFWGLLVTAVLGRAAPAVEPTVPGLNELVILEPGKHERGLPAVELKPHCGGLLVDIPPTVHVHRYYYSGDKEYQGPIIQGGPTVVVANHPKTGRRMYVEVTLPPGAPRIAHCRTGITYVYPDRRVMIRYLSCFPEEAVVKYSSGRGMGRRVREYHEAATSTASRAIQSSPLLQSVKETTAEGGKLIAGATGGAESMSAQLLDAARQAVQALPGVSALRSYADEREMRANAAELRGAAARQARSALEYIPTNR
jgi:hypothetical protein